MAVADPQLDFIFGEGTSYEWSFDLSGILFCGLCGGHGAAEEGGEASLDRYGAGDLHSDGSVLHGDRPPVCFSVHILPLHRKKVNEFQKNILHKEYENYQSIMYNGEGARRLPFPSWAVS